MRTFVLFFLITVASFAQTSPFPGALDTDVNLRVQVNGTQTSLAGSLNATAASAQVASCSGIVPNTFATIDQEIISISGCSGTTLSFNTTGAGCTNGRGCDNSTATNHNNRRPVTLYIVAWHDNALRKAVEAIEQTLGTNLSNIPIFAVGSAPSGACTANVIEIVAPVGTIYTCQSGTWAQVSGGGGGGANTALSNLSAVSINTSLLPQTGVDAGSAAEAFRHLFFYGTGTYGSTSFEFVGTPTANRTISAPDANSNTVIPQSCSNQVITALSSAGVLSCTSLTSSYLPLSAMGTITGGVWNGTPIANAFIANPAVTINAASPLGGGGSVSLGGTLNLTCSTCGSAAISPLSVSTTSTVLTIGPNCSNTTPCNVNVGNTIYAFTAPITVTISSGSDTAYGYVIPSGAMNIATASVTPTCSGCTAVTGSSFPTNSTPIFRAAFTSGVWTTTPTDERAFLGRDLTSVGTGLTSSFSGGVQTISLSVPTPYSIGLAGGLAGSVPYQTAVNATTFLPFSTFGTLSSSGTAPAWVKPSANGQCYMSDPFNFSTATPSFQACPSGGGNVSASGSPLQFQLSVWSSASTITGVAPSATVGVPVISQGTSAYPTFGAINLAGGSSIVSGVLPVGNLPGAAGEIIAGAGPALTATPGLGTDNSVAGTLTLANGSASAHTVVGSAATTTNTVKFFATTPVTGDLVSATTSGTTTTFADSGILASSLAPYVALACNYPTTSDTAALNAALSVAGAYVRMPPNCVSAVGNVSITANNVTFDFNGSTIKAVSGTTGIVLAASTVSNVVVKNGIIDGDSINGLTWGWQCSNCTNVQTGGLTVQNMGTPGSSNFASGVNFFQSTGAFTNSHVTAIAGYCLEMNGPSAAFAWHGNHLDHCYKEGALFSGVIPTWSGAANVIDHVYDYGAASTGAYGNGVYINSSSTGGNVTGLTIAQTEYSGIRVASSQKVNVSANKISNSGDWGIYAQDFAGGENSITANDISDGLGGCITADNASDQLALGVAIHGNHCYNMAGSSTNAGSVTPVYGVGILGDAVVDIGGNTVDGAYYAYAITNGGGGVFSNFGAAVHDNFAQDTRPVTITVTGTSGSVSGAQSGILADKLYFGGSLSAATAVGEVVSCIPISSGVACTSPTSITVRMIVGFFAAANSIVDAGPTGNLTATVGTVTGQELQNITLSASTNFNLFDFVTIGSGATQATAQITCSTSVTTSTGCPTANHITVQLTVNPAGLIVPMPASGTLTDSTSSATATISAAAAIKNNQQVSYMLSKDDTATTCSITAQNNFAYGYAVSAYGGIHQSGAVPDGTVYALGSGSCVSNSQTTGAANDLVTTNGLGGFGTPIVPASGIATWITTPSSANLLAAMTTKTGTGSLVFGTAPTITLANGSGLPISTGVSGLGTGVATFLATPSGANLTSALTSPLTVAGGGTGLATLTASAIYKGNGTSAIAVSSISDNGTAVTITEPLAIGSSAPACTGNGLLCIAENTGQANVSGSDALFANSTQQGFLPFKNGGTALPLPQNAATTTSGDLACQNSANGSLLSDCGVSLSSLPTSAGCPGTLNISITALPATTANFAPCKTNRSLSLKNLEAVASGSTFTCATPPVITLQDCGTSAGSCGSPTPLAAVTLSVANTITDSGTTFPVTVSSGHYLSYQITTGTCIAVPAGLSASLVYY